MKALDIVEIIKAGNLAKVSELEYNGLKIKYSQPNSIISDFTESQSAPSTQNKPAPITKFQKEFEDSQLMFTNPVAYEDSLSSGDGNEDTNG